MKLWILLFLAFINTKCYSQTSYILLSNNVVKKHQMEVLSNNIANADTIGFQEDMYLSKAYNHKESKKKISAYLLNSGNTINTETGQFKYTGRDLDFATSNGYFKVLTPLGYRYTLDGHAQLNTDRELVNSLGFRYMSNNDEVIVIPLNTTLIYTSQEGRMYVDGVEIGRIGVFDVPRASITKDLNGLYKSSTGDTLNEEYTVLSGHLVESNVNIHKVSVSVSETSRSSKVANSILRDSANLELNVINSALK